MSDEDMGQALRASRKYEITPSVVRTAYPQQTSTPKLSRIDILKQMTESRQIKQSPSAGVCHLFDGTGAEGENSNIHSQYISHSSDIPKNTAIFW